MALASTGLLAMAPAPRAAADPPGDQPPDSHGIDVLAWDDVDPDVLNPDDRPVWEATVASSAVFTGPNGAPAPLKVRIHLPAGYDHDRAAGYPVLVLLHGGAGDRTGWTNGHEGNLTAALQSSGYPGIVVMPEGGYSGWYRDWVGNTQGGFRPLWETFHMGQLMPWVESSFNTSDERADWALAGVSMGGYGALTYAARHPGRFGTVASFSGGTDITAQAPPGSSTSAAKMIDNALGPLGASVPDHWAGNPLLPGPGQEDRLVQMLGPRSGWHAVNPWDLAAAGAYTPFDEELHLYAGDDELELNAWNRAFSARLAGEPVDHETCFGDGSHSWTYFRGQLAHFMRVLAGVPEASNPCPFGDT
jgi:S-formylglutathione hydrolase FrmB